MVRNQRDFDLYPYRKRRLCLSLIFVTPFLFVLLSWLGTFLSEVHDFFRELVHDVLGVPARWHPDPGPIFLKVALLYAYPPLCLLGIWGLFGRRPPNSKITIRLGDDGIMFSKLRGSPQYVPWADTFARATDRSLDIQIGRKCAKFEIDEKSKTIISSVLESIRELWDVRIRSSDELLLQVVSSPTSAYRDAGVPVDPWIFIHDPRIAKPRRLEVLDRVRSQIASETAAKDFECRLCEMIERTAEPVLGDELRARLSAGRPCVVAKK